MKWMGVFANRSRRSQSDWKKGVDALRLFARAQSTRSRESASGNMEVYWFHVFLGRGPLPQADFAMMNERFKFRYSQRKSRPPAMRAALASEGSSTKGQAMVLMSTTRSTRSGWASAKSSEMGPPKSWATRVKRGRFNASMTAAKRRAWASGE